MADGTITAKQKEILEYIKSEILKRGFLVIFWNMLRKS